MNRFLLVSAAALITMGLTTGCDGARGGGPGPMVDLDGGVGGTDAATLPPGTDAGTTTPPGGGAPGSTCNCDSDCAADGTHAGICVVGVCMTRASAACASSGSQAECPAGSRCWGLEGYDGGICWPDCDAHSCAGMCDGDGSCVASDGMNCDAACGAVCSGGGTSTGDCPPNAHAEGDGCVCDEGFVVNADRSGCVRECETDPDCGGGGLVCVDNECRTPPCTTGSCGSGLLCDTGSGNCVIDIGTPPPGPVPTCAAGVGDVPDWRCTSGCSELVQWDPDTGPGWWDYPLNGESDSDQYRSFVRRDVMMLVKYATAMVACQASGWSFGNGGNLGLGDMSEGDGAIPGTRDGSPGHPPGTHVNGHDMDIAYYQTGTSDNRLRAVCEHRSGDADQYHCVSEPTMLDPWRTALFLGHLNASPNVRVIGVDGRIGAIMESALPQLCSGGWLPADRCPTALGKLAYEETNTGAGWYLHHHHHLHISIRG